MQNKGITLNVLDFQIRETRFSTQRLQAVQCSGEFLKRFPSHELRDDFLTSLSDRHWPSIDILLSLINKTLSIHNSFVINKFLYV